MTAADQRTSGVGASDTHVDCRKGWRPKFWDRNTSTLGLSPLQVQLTMATTSTPTGGTITGPITDTATYTYTDLDTSFTPPESCLSPIFTSLLASMDPVLT